ncbi:MAG: sulfur carrier protein ThiS [Pyrinomonadaceae bacterium]|nr:sulfur carrier protein ThiS [Phycisphaerales bacterium]
MTVRVNGKEMDVGDRVTVAQLLEQLSLATSACAVEVNTLLIPKAQHRDTQLQEGDVVEVVTLVGGG